MVYYKDNKSLSQLKTVTTVKGDTEYRRNTKFIKEKYYTINRDCFQFNDKWYTVDGGNIVYDYEKGVYILKNRQFDLIKGIVMLENNKLGLGCFSHNPYNNVSTNSSLFGRVVAINSEILEKDGWFEDMGSNVWYFSKELTSSGIASRKKIRNEKSFTDRGYNIEDNQADYITKTALYNNYPIHISPKAKEMSKYLGDLTFGIEVELHRGNIGDELKNRYGIVVCRDGSLNGGAELVSIPLQGAKGLQTISDLGNSLRDRSDINLDCSFHIHFGNIGTDKLSIIALYRLARNLQGELFSMFPYYKTDPSGLKQKNYTKKLLKLNINSLKDNSKEAYELYLLDSWTKLFNFYSEGLMTPEQFDKISRRHPIERKWERKSRLKIDA